MNQDNIFIENFNLLQIGLNVNKPTFVCILYVTPLHKHEKYTVHDFDQMTFWKCNYVA